MMKRFTLLIAFLLAATLISCGDDGVRPKKKDVTFWVLVRQQGIPANGEVLLYNLTDSLVERRFSVPAGLGSPHALAWDGVSLWIGGAYQGDSLYEVDPDDGSVTRAIPDIRTEGVAAVGSTLWYSTVSVVGDSLIQISREGTQLRKIPVADPVVNDLDTNGEWLYYAVNDDVDRIVRVDWNSGAAADFIAPAVEGNYLYAIAIYKDLLYVVDAQRQGNTLRTFNRLTGEFESNTPLAIDGWITGIRRVD